MKTFFNKSKITAALLLGGALMTAGAAHAAPVDFTFNTANIVGSTTAHSFIADEINMTSVGLGSFTFTDTTAPFGVIGAADSFVEFGITSAINFQNNNINIPIPTTGLGINYELLAQFTLKGIASIVGTNVVVNFFPGSGSTASIYYDEILNNAIDGATIIGQLTKASGDCVFTGAVFFAEGSCKINFAFDDAAVSDPGVWTYMSGDLGDRKTTLTLDINGHDIKTSSPLPLYPASGVIAGTLQHDGTATFGVPEPGTIAIMGLGLLGLAGFARRRGRTSN